MAILEISNQDEFDAEIKGPVLVVVGDAPTSPLSPDPNGTSSGRGVGRGTGEGEVCCRGYGRAE